MNTQIPCNVIILSILLSLFPLAVSADDDHSIEFVVKNGDSLYKICDKILENPEDWRWVAMVNQINNPHQQSRRHEGPNSGPGLIPIWFFKI